MQRPIKFRAWFPATEWMNTFEEGMDYVIDPSDGELMFEGGSSTNAVLMQYTGLKDKNGVEIYEGDIVLYTDDFGSPWMGILKTPKVIEFHDGAFEAVDPEKGAVFSGRDIPKGGYAAQAEVIGNIYSNPDLLGGGHDS